MKELAKVAWLYVSGLLPYPDLRRRWRMRRQARRLVTVTKWPGDDATGPEVAQLALLRLLWLQRRIRRAVRGRRREEAALLARTAVDTLLIGLYCLHDDGAVAHLAGANYKTFKRLLSTVVVPGLMSQEAIRQSVPEFGQPGEDLKIGRVAARLAADHRLAAAQLLYDGYYAPLSHFFEHANAYTLLRHVSTGDETVASTPWHPWVRRGPVRLGDGCAGLLAAPLAEHAARDPEPFRAYAAAHLDRLRLPLVATALGTALRSIPPRHLAGAIGEILAVRRYTHHPPLGASQASREARVRAGLTRTLSLVRGDLPEGSFAAVIDDLVARIVAEMSESEHGQEENEGPSAL